MKMTPQRYDELKTGIKQIVDHYGRQNLGTPKSPTSLLWKLFHAVTEDFQYHDDHPLYRQRSRILPHQDDHWLNKMYASGLNDTHIETALKRIGKELNLTG